jgi:hypothetical protein
MVRSIMSRSADFKLSNNSKPFAMKTFKGGKVRHCRLQVFVSLKPSIYALSYFAMRAKDSRRT